MKIQLLTKRKPNFCCIGWVWSRQRRMLFIYLTIVAIVISPDEQP